MKVGEAGGVVTKAGVYNKRRSNHATTRWRKVTEEKGDDGGGVEDPEQSGPKRGGEGVDGGGGMESNV
jgi:hypothetical protein